MQHLRGELLNGPAIKDGDAEGLLRFADRMYQCEVTFDGLDKMWMLNSQDLMHDLFGRLPHRIKVQFVTISSSGNLSSFSDLRTLVEKAASEADSEYGRLLYKFKTGQSSSRPQDRPTKNHRLCAAQHSAHSVVERVGSTSQPLVCECCSGCHKLWKCASFEAKTVEERRALLKEKGLCFNCLLSGHRVSQCRVKIVCRKCSKRHNTLHHWDWQPQGPLEKIVAVSSTEEREIEQDSGSVVCAATQQDDCFSSLGGVSSILKVVPVKVWANDPGEHVLTYAFIDEGSNINMCSSHLAKRLGVSTSATNVQLLTSNAISVLDRKIDDLVIQGVNELEAFRVGEAFVVDNVIDVSSSIPTNDLVQRHSHLRRLKFPELEEGRVDLLLGCDMHRAFLIKDVLVGNPGSPCGLHTALGWTIFGTDKGNIEAVGSPQLMVNFMTTLGDEDRSCEQLIKLFSQDFDDIDENKDDTSLSQEDKRALYILNDTVKKVDDHFSVGLLWKDDLEMSSDGRALAERRLKGLKRRFEKDPDLFQRYSEKMSEYISKYAEPVCEESEQNGRCRYIPHHCTALESKFRVVFDCSARSGDGESLNDKLLPGPDLVNSIVGVLIRFRQHPVEVVADIKGMFSQVMVEEADRDALRFLWYLDDDISQAPVVYRMKTHVFGAKSSPCCAAFALRMTGSENATGAKQNVVNAVMKNVYVDDVCVSCVTESEASDLVHQLRQLLASGGFHLTKFVSNSRTVLEQLPPDDILGDVHLSEELPVHKTLGMFWDASSDQLRVRVNIKKGPCTRRGLLSMIGQTYDPLGLIQPFLLPARRLLQQACASKLGWDDDISNVPGLESDWGCWFASLPELEQVVLARCLVPADVVTRVELHTFSDASTVGYGACTYLRSVYQNGMVRCCIVMGKSRVAPLKKISIPRLELVAAVLAARLGNLVRKELDITVDEVYYWTDATVVLRYINNSSSRFETFVGNRIEILHTLTSVSQWRYVPTEVNPADMASRGIPPKECSFAKLWFDGPSFLKCNCNDWPEQPKFLVELPENDPEVKKRPKKCFSQRLKEEEEGILRLFKHYSDFMRLQRAVSWLLRFKTYVRYKHSNYGKPPSTGPLTADECDDAFDVIIRSVQANSFKEVINILSNQFELDDPVNPVTEEIIKKSPDLQRLQSLSPFVVRGMLRVGGRLRKATLPYERKYPLLLPHQHPVTDLLIKLHHEREGHLGVNHVLAELIMEKKPSTWLTSFGSNGLISTCLCFSPSRSGSEPLPTCSREIWS